MIDRIAKEVFPDFEKWDAFIELNEQKVNLQNYWIKEYQRILKEKFQDEFLDWNIHFENNLNVFFYPIGYSERKSLEIWLENGFQLSFWINRELFDAERVKKLIKIELPLIEMASNEIISFNDNLFDPYLFRIQLKYNLPAYISDFNRLIYFADKGLPEEIIRIIRPILKNERILQLFKNINDQCLKIN